jgi:hypothetical protein
MQHYTLNNLFISGNCSIYFGCYFHPSSGEHTTVPKASAICHTVAATASIVWQIPDAVDTDVCAPDDGWWYHPKYVAQFPDINKLCKVASRWIYIWICLFDMFRTTKCSSLGRCEHAGLGYSFMHPYKLSGWCQDVSEYQTHPTGLELISTYLILLAILQ